VFVNIARSTYLRWQPPCQQRTRHRRIVHRLDESGIGDVSELYDVFLDYHSKSLPEDEASSMEMISEPSESSNDEDESALTTVLTQYQCTMHNKGLLSHIMLVQ